AKRGLRCSASYRKAADMARYHKMQKAERRRRSSGAVFVSTSPLVGYAQIRRRFAIAVVTTHHTKSAPCTQPRAEVHARTGVQLVPIAWHAGLQHVIVEGDAISGTIAVPVGRQIRADRGTRRRARFTLQAQASTTGQAAVTQC